MTTARILVIDDAPEIGALLDVALTRTGYEVRTAPDGLAGLDIVTSWQPDVVLLDLDLGAGIDGLEVCRRLRAVSEAYVLMLTARTEEVDRIVGLTMGADDYVGKPFNPREIHARVEALLRRRRPAASPSPANTASERTSGQRFGDVEIDPESREVVVAGSLVELTKIEFEILHALTENPKRVITREQLRERVWGGGWFGDDHAVDVHVSNLRRKLTQAGAPTVVGTVRGVGYRLAVTLVSTQGN